MLETVTRRGQGRDLEKGLLRMAVPWLGLALFMASVGLLALYGLAFSGHFPADCRDSALRTARGASVLWGTLAMTVVAAMLAGDAATRVLRWPLVIIGSGAMLLAAPLLLRLFSDRFVNGISALTSFAGGALAISVVLMLLALS
jgi:hypothetical protein